MLSDLPKFIQQATTEPRLSQNHLSMAPTLVADALCHLRKQDQGHKAQSLP